MRDINFAALIGNISSMHVTNDFDRDGRFFFSYQLKLFCIMTQINYSNKFLNLSYILAYVYMFSYFLCIFDVNIEMTDVCLKCEDTFSTLSQISWLDCCCSI